MAPATQTATSADPGARTAPADAESVTPSAPTSAGAYRCACGHELHVFGTGRHRIYSEPDNTRRDDPVMNGVCPACGRALPGKS